MFMFSLTETPRLRSRLSHATTRSKQPRYKRNKKCELWPIFEGENDWKIVELRAKSAAEAKGDAARSSQYTVLQSMVARMTLLIKQGGRGAFGTEAEDTDGYYMVDFTSEPYTLQEDMETEDFGTLAAVETVVVDAEYLNPVQRARRWFTPPPRPRVAHLNVTIPVSLVLRAGLELLPISAQDKLPSNCDVKAAKQKGAVKVSSDDHEAILEEAERRDRLEFDPEDSESEGESEDEGEEEGDQGDEEED